jgi:phenylacetate-CoA ligase
VSLSLDIEPELNPQKIESILSAGVTETVAYAKQKSLFYREHLAKFPYIKSLSDLAALPLTTKKDVSQHNEDFWCVAREKIIDLCTTSGTTGIPTLYPLTAGDLDRLGQNEFLCFRRVGITADDLVILAVTVDKCFMAGLAYFEGLRKLGAGVVRVGAGSPAMMLSMIQRLRPTAIVSVPSFLKRIADYAKQQNFDLKSASVRKLICIGEPIREADLAMTPLAAHVSDAWRATLFSTYGITELASSLCECEAGQGGHLHPQLLHVEILDDGGRPVPDGQSGQLVATTIGVEAMPLIRFATGDITYLSRERCGCGLWTPRIGPILGRREQAMKIKGTTVYPAAVQRALQGLDNIIDYLMIASAPTTLSDELEVLIAWRGDAAGAQEVICDKLRGELKVCPTVRLTTLQEIQILGDSRDLRKQRVFVDRRKSDIL